MYDECANQLCEEGHFITCRDVEMGLTCIDSEGCEPGCICMNGTVRDENGNCVEDDECNYCFLPNGDVLPPGDSYLVDGTCEKW